MYAPFFIPQFAYAICMSAFASVEEENRIARNLNAQTIGGMDEVGRGAVAGPLVSCCIIRKTTTTLESLKDSKELSPVQRHRLVPYIFDNSVAWGIGIVTVPELTRNGMTWAVTASFNRALKNAVRVSDVLFYDGRALKLDHQHAHPIIDGDATHATIAAASIIAKVVRDCFMHELDAELPLYGFAEHKGYGTAQHMASIIRNGMIDGIHRPLFLRNIAAGKKTQYT